MSPEISRRLVLALASAGTAALVAANITHPLMAFAAGEPVWSHPFTQRAAVPFCGQFSLTPLACRNNATHQGLDYAGGGSYAGAWIHAVAPGVVQAVGWNSNWGYRAVVGHSGGWNSLYAHMIDNSSPVVVGQSVNRGTQLGKVGETGKTTGPHLHIEIRGPQGLVDPAPRLNNAPLATTAVQEDDMAQGAFYRHSVNGGIYWQEKPNSPLIGLNIITWKVYAAYGATHVDLPPAEIEAIINSYGVDYAPSTSVTVANVDELAQAIATALEENT